jgi:hypothetical protein
VKPPPGLTVEERRKWLVSACELDRLRLRLAAQPSALERITLSILENVIPFAPHLPGKIGKWSRGIMQGTQIFKSVYQAMRN